MEAEQSQTEGQPGVPFDPFDLPPPDLVDPVIEAYKKDVDRTLLRENLKLTVEQRLQRFEASMRMFVELRAAGQRLRAKGASRD